MSDNRKDFLFYQKVLAQQPKDKNKIYSLHEPDVYVKMIKRHWSGILQWKLSSINNGILEGLNSVIQAAKRKARHKTQNTKHKTQNTTTSLLYTTAFMKILNYKLSSTNELLTARIGLLATAHTINTLII
jgi:hypothetical protein